MNVSKHYRWSGAENGAEYTGNSERDNRKMCWYDTVLGDPLPMLSEWVSPSLTQYRGGNGKRKPRPLCDSPSSASINLISQRAAEVLSDIWDRHATLYPVTLDDADDQKYYMVVVDTLLDCLDREKSSGPLQKYGPTPDMFASIYEWVFDEECIGDNDLFTTPDSKTSIFTSDRFRACVSDAGLKGFCFRKSFWDENPWIS